MTRDEYEDYLQRIPYDAMGDFSFLCKEKKGKKCEEEPEECVKEDNKFHQQL